jgi:hypothetical protein
MRTFETGATRDSNEHKPDYSGFLSPKAIKRFGEYMLKNQVQADGSRREANNWKRGMPVATYVESGFRHMIEFWDLYEEGKLEEADDVACAILFNVQGYLHERAKAEAPPAKEKHETLTATPAHVDCSALHTKTGYGCTRPVGHTGAHWATYGHETGNRPQHHVCVKWAA